MAKGTLAKGKVVEKIKEAFGDDYIGEYNNKYYVWAKENGEKIQIAISLTCPKNPVGEVNAPNFDGGLDFSTPAAVAPTVPEPAEITQEEQDRLATLLESLGL